jgi:hypothetical protein
MDFKGHLIQIQFNLNDWIFFDTLFPNLVYLSGRQSPYFLLSALWRFLPENTNLCPEYYNASLLD